MLWQGTCTTTAEYLLCLLLSISPCFMVTLLQIILICYMLFTSAATEVQFEEARIYIERNVMSHIYTHAMFPNGDGDIMRDQLVLHN